MQKIKGKIIPSMYEGHLTLIQNPELREQIIKAGKLHNMHYSEINGWDEIKPGLNAFLTAHDSNDATMLRRLKAMRALLVAMGVKVTRLKIEDCVHDERYR